MLKSIEYTVQFASTGRVLHEKITFQKGFGAITGPNESGKSMVLELVRWSLFGSAALRGSASDYVKVHGALAFSVKGVGYFVTRASNGATLKRGDVEIATGTKPVNAKVVEILGFGLPVFDIACAANQNALLALGEMKPTERKRLVDSVIGLGVIEDMGKLAGEEANALKRRYEDLSSSLIEPIEPVEPPGYIKSSTLKVELAQKRSLKSDYDQLVGWLSVDKPKVKRPETDIPMSSDDLQDMADTQTALRRRVAELEKLTPPKYTEDELSSFHLMNIGYENQTRFDQLKKRLDHLRSHQIECPECGHEWSLDGTELAKVEADMHILSAVNIFAHKPSHLSNSQIEVEITKTQSWNGDHLIELEQISKTLDKQPDFRPMVAKRIMYEQALARYEADVQSYDDWTREYQKRLTIRNELELEIADLADLQNAYEDAREYEGHLSFYDTVLEDYRSAVAIAHGVKVEAEDWAKARTALATLRSKVKQHLVPSLNRVASHLLKEMTGGQRQTIDVSEDFEITVDGQPLRTLSGSGMAVANLAIRIGLGQVLTNNVFSIFMADEIDASMDETRATATVDSLKKLSGSISQILMVTHKSPTADYHIQLGNTNDQPDHSDY